MRHAWARARSLPTSTVAVAGLTVAGLHVAPPVLQIGLPQPLRSTWFTLLGTVVAAALPLAPAYGVLERTFSRACTDRALRAAVTCALVSLALIADRVLLATPVGVLIWALMLLGVAFALSAVRPEWAWAWVFAIGGATLVWEHASYTSVISRACDELGLIRACTVVGLAVVAYVIRRP